MINSCIISVGLSALFNQAFFVLMSHFSHFKNLTIFLKILFKCQKNIRKISSFTLFQICLSTGLKEWVAEYERWRLRRSGTWRWSIEHLQAQHRTRWAVGGWKAGKTKMPQNQSLSNMKAAPLLALVSAKKLLGFFGRFQSSAEEQICCKIVIFHTAILKQLKRPICVWNIYVTPGTEAHNQVS